jgi:hypothetical protein
MNLHGRGQFTKSAVFVCASILILSLRPLSAKTNPVVSPAISPIPLRVRVYGFPGLSSRVLMWAEKETDRMLRDSKIRLDWMECPAERHTSSCFWPQLPNELVVRILPNALPGTSRTALGVASYRENSGALIFYDRVIHLRAPMRPLPIILGRVMAHEITHLLLAGQPHSDTGLMRGTWSEEDLGIGSFACRGFTPKSIRLMQNEVARRTARIKTGARAQDR